MKLTKMRSSGPLADLRGPGRQANYYRSQQLREGNVFTGVCQSVHRGRGDRVSLVSGPFLVSGPMSFQG